MSSGQCIPTVTQEDLADFHAEVYGTSAPANSLPRHLETESVKGEEFVDGYEIEDDDLGYYADGKKRTLTDEQIAMFRHSEIYCIVRGRQVRKENAEAADNQSPQTIEDNGVGQLATETPIETVGDCPEEPKAHLPKSSDGTHKRRKVDRHPRNGQSRRSVRELDAIVANDEELNYGEEDQGLPDHRVPIPLPESNTLQETLYPSSEGRSIWWPVIEA
ncbi:MAG: hypothetical protein Q9217_004701 [Psora testacea]